MDDYSDFTLSPSRFPAEEVANFVNELHEAGQHLVPIVDVGIPVGDSHPYLRGEELGVFLKSTDGSTFVGKVGMNSPDRLPDLARLT